MTLTTRLLEEVIGHTPLTFPLVKALFIEKATVIGHGVGHAEFAILEGDQYHRHTIGTLGIPLGDGLWQHIIATCGSALHLSYTGDTLL